MTKTTNEVLNDLYRFHEHEAKRVRGESVPVAYLHKTKTGYVLTICAKPCNGDEFNNSQKIEVSGKREANQICKDSGFVAYNF